MLRASSLFRSYSSSSRFRRIWRDIYFHAWAGIRMYLGYSKPQIRQHIGDFWHLQTRMYSNVFLGRLAFDLKLRLYCMTWRIVLSSPFASPPLAPCEIETW